MKKFFGILPLAALVLAGCSLLTGSSDNSGNAAQAAAVFEKPECLEKRIEGESQFLVICGTDGIFTYLIQPRITVNFRNGGFDVTSFNYGGAPTHMEGVEVTLYPSNARSSTLGIKASLLGPQGGLVAADGQYSSIRARSFVSDLQGHIFWTEYTHGVGYSN